MDMNRFSKRLLLMVVVAASAPAVSQQMPWQPQTRAECEAQALRRHSERIEMDCARRSVPERTSCEKQSYSQYRSDWWGCLIQRLLGNPPETPVMPVLPPPPAPPRPIA
jgi:hypothetical protein